MIKHQHNPLFILSLLGALCVVSPFAIDLYLPAFTQMAAGLNTTTATVSLSLSSYFVGLAGGQFIYGPLLDRFGRKKPIYAGLTLFCAASVGCMMTDRVEVLIALRLLQGLGGCAAQVGAIAMVHDFFPVKESAKIFSLLFLFIGASPLFAPTIGSLLTAYLGWRWVFAFMFALVSAIFAAVMFLLPEGHVPDPTISLKSSKILRTFLQILEHRGFIRYTLAGAFSFAGLFSYVAGAPIMFMEQFHVTAREFGVIFAILAGGFIGGSQVNVFLLKHFSSEKIFGHALQAQVLSGIVFLAATYFGWIGLIGTLALTFVFLACTGISNPNGSALALAPFTKNAGSASALLGAIQMGTGALVSTSVGAIGAKSSLPIICILAVTSFIGLAVYWLFRPHKPA